MPSSFKLRGGEGKWLLKKAMEPYLPNDVLYRPKMGFAVPLARWFRGPLRARVRDALLGERLLRYRRVRSDARLKAAGRPASVGRARPQRAALDAADVRGVSARQRIGAHARARCCLNAAMDRAVRMLTVSSLYPSKARPRHGIFVENRLVKLIEFGEVLARVIAPVPWFPFTSNAFGEYARYAATPQQERRRGIDVAYPRYPMVPRVSTALQPALVAAAVARSAAHARDDGFDFDLLDAHYLYPDGVASATVAARFRKPLVITARGSDINVIAQMPQPRRRILEAARSASALIAVSAALKAKMVDLGMDAERIHVIRNGVDMSAYAPIEQALARESFGLAHGFVIASVGNLVPGKGHDLVMRAIAGMDAVTLLIVGSGPQRASLGELARELGIGSRVRLIGELAPERMPAVYSAADLLVLASSSEGWPNVVLEALACGTPVVATDVGGVPEILTADVAGTIVAERTTETIAAAVGDRLARVADRAAVRAFASRFSWDEVVRQQTALYQRIAAERTPVARATDAIAAES